MSEWSELLRAFFCPHCKAQPGEPCRTVSGRTATQEHSSRSEPVRAAWTLGYLEGRGDLAAEYLRAIQGDLNDRERFHRRALRAIEEAEARS